jgi:hypothetical protein
MRQHTLGYHTGHAGANGAPAMGQSYRGGNPHIIQK